MNNFFFYQELEFLIPKNLFLVPEKIYFDKKKIFLAIKNYLKIVLNGGT